MASIEGLIHDWNEQGSVPAPQRPIQFDDETLRDGLQSPTVRDPGLDDKFELLELMDRLGIHTANIGLPGAGGRPRQDILAMARYMADQKLTIRPNVACRTVVSDIEPVVEMTQKAGIPIEVCAFIGSSAIRQFAEDWTLEMMLDHTRKALEFARSHDLPVMYVTEDTTRAHPDVIKALYTTAIELGARRLCVCDTVGHATPRGTRAVIQYVRQLADEHDKSIGVDWHGHRDRDLGIANCLAAIEAGADRIHGSALGVGERTGNAPMDLLLVNCRLQGWIDNDLSALPEYVRTAARSLEVDIPYNYPVLGQDAFETGTGVHAAAVIKAFRKGDVPLADSVYSGVPAHMVGLEQSIRVGPMSGRSNATWVLERMGVEPSEERVEKVLQAGKSSKKMLTAEQIRAVLDS
ncbi:MAG: LeuA family protein [Planctomycetota bacterium]|nr:LeuA family protein [Planctomycetota bacterium]